MPLEWLEFGFKCFESCLNLHSHASNLVLMFRICIWIPVEWFEFTFECFESLFEWFEFGFECFESLWNGSTPFRMVRTCLRMLLSPFRIVQIYNRMLRIPFEWLEFGHECFEFLLNGSNLDSNASNPFRMVWICIRMLQNDWNGQTFHLNASNPIRMVRIYIWMLRIAFEWLEFGFECFESLSNR